jgi:sugar phosphate isomerase/epimerase
MAMPPVGFGCATLFTAGVVDIIELAARHGFPTITARPAAFLEALEEGETGQGLRRRLSDAGVTVRVIDGLSHALPGKYLLREDDPRLAHLPREVFHPPSEEECLRACAELEAPLLSVAHFGHEPVPPGPIAERVGEICCRAARHGVTLALEFVPDTGLADLPTAGWIARNCGEPNCGVLLDPWHWSRTRGTLEQVRALEPGALVAMQLCDRIAEPEGTLYTPMAGRLMPGEGELPLYELVEACLANSPGLTIEAEVINAELNAMSFDEAGAALASAIAGWRAGYDDIAGKRREP